MSLYERAEEIIRLRAKYAQLSTTECAAIVQAEAIEHLARAVRSIAHGDVNGATGLEALGMLLRDHDFNGSNIAAAIDRVAERAAVNREVTGSIPGGRVLLRGKVLHCNA